MRTRKGMAAVMALLLCVVLLLPQRTEAAGEPPSVGAEGAVLLNANTGEILYNKNGDTQYYPASITKMMTALLVLENCSMEETVTFSRGATTNLESGAVHLNLSAGDRVSVRDCLYGLMLYSANDVANGLAEHVGGSIPAFADRMNARARQLGATRTNFVNPNGLNNAAHVTTPRDMAWIAKGCFENAAFRQIVGTTSYTFPATRARASAKTIRMGHKMVHPDDARYYEGIIGGKTGYTRLAKNTLVTAAQRNGVLLIAVVMKCPGTQYNDTRALLDYGFSQAGSAQGGNGTASQESPSNTAGSVQGTQAGEVSGSRGPNDPVDENQKTGPGMNIVRGWHQENGNRRWYYIKDNLSWAVDENLLIGGYVYWFDPDGYMATGWRQDSAGNWFYLMDWGGMQMGSWLFYNGLWYYLGSDGKMLVNTTTPDGYQVNGDGVWVN